MTSGENKNPAPDTLKGEKPMDHKSDNQVTVIMQSHSKNEAFARVVVSAFVAPLDPTVGELTDIKTAVSEAVTNAIIHGYENTQGDIHMTLAISGRTLTVEVSDEGIGIEDIENAMAPLFTTKPELERSGMGFTVMESFMDTVTVRSEKGHGTTVVMTKKIGR